MNKEEFYKILKARYSVRRYKKDPIPADVIERILDTGREAASAANRQPWYFILCQGNDKEKMNRVFYKDGFKDAPVAIVAIADPKQAWIRKADGRNFAYVDVAIAVTEMILTATAEGLGTCWIAAFEYDHAKKILHIPDDMEIVTLLTIGYPHQEEKQPERTRKTADEVILKGSF